MTKQGTFTYRNQKEIFRLWFEYLKRAYRADGSLVSKSQKRAMRRIYELWGDVEFMRFDSWWKVNSDALFAEPDVRLVTSPNSVSPDQLAEHFCLLVPKNLSIEQVKRRIEQTLPRVSTQSRAKFGINTSSKVHAKEGLRYALRVYDHLESGKTAWQVFDAIEREDLAFNVKWKHTKRLLRDSPTSLNWRFRGGVDVRTPKEGDGYYRVPQLVGRSKKLALRTIKSVSIGKFPS